jgi:hypothetical protein
MEFEVVVVGKSRWSDFERELNQRHKSVHIPVYQSRLTFLPPSLPL